LITLKTNDNKLPLLYISNRKFDEAKIWYEDALNTNLTLSQFLNKSVVTIKKSYI